MILLIDMGNSRIKWCLRQQGITVQAGSEDYSARWDWLAALAASYSLAAVYVACVNGAHSQRRLVLECQALRLPAPQWAVSEPRGGGVINGYDEPESLGVDRWLALVAARELTSSACVVVDSGTALTVDLLAADGRHLGGYIGPGLKLMRDSLARGSKTLAQRMSECALSSSSAPGANTADAINGALCAMGQGLIACGQRQLATEEVILTGGDAPVWQALYPSAQLCPALVFNGLQRYFARRDDVNDNCVRDA